MRIGASYPQSTTETQAADKSAGASKGSSAAASSATQSSSGGDSVKVTVSAKARELDEAQAPETSEKVQRLQALVQSGQLPVDPAKIAAAIIGE